MANQRARRISALSAPWRVTIVRSKVRRTVAAGALGLCVFGMIDPAREARAAGEGDAALTPLERRVEVIQATRAGVEGLPILKEALRDEAMIVRSAAIQGLETLGTPARDALAMVVTDHPDFRTRHRAMAALHAIDALTFEYVAAQMSGRLEVSPDAMDRPAGEVLPAVLLEDWRFMTGRAGGALFFTLFEPDFKRKRYVARGTSARGEVQFVDEGPSGRAVKISPDDSTPAQQHALRLSRSLPMLTPEGDFTIEMWLRPSAAMDGRRNAHLIDKMGSARAGTDYSIRLVRAEEGGHRVHVGLGFRKDESDQNAVAHYRSEPVEFETDRWHHLAFTYDGVGGGRIYLDGKIVGRQRHTGRGSIVGGHVSLAIGDRTVANHGPFPGCIDQVRIHHKRIAIDQVTHRDYKKDQSR